MKYHTLLFSKIRKEVKQLSYAAVVIDNLRVNSFHGGERQLLPSGDNLCKQFRPRSCPTIC